MKTKAYFFVSIVFLISTSCHQIDDIFEHINGEKTEGKTFQTDEIFPVHFFVADENGDLPSDPESLVYENRKMNPILAPDGHQLTFKEFNAVKGKLSMKCTPNGTQYKVMLEGLVPYGTYTIWTVIFDESGTPPPVAAGTDKMQGSFVANPNGKATYTGLVPGGEMSQFGNAADCLMDEPVVRIFGAYHIDSQIYGGYPGPAGTYLEQFGWAYIRN